MSKTLPQLQNARDYFAELKNKTAQPANILDLAPVIPQLGIALELTRDTTEMESMLLTGNDTWQQTRESAERVLREALKGNYEVPASPVVENNSFEAVSHNIHGRIVKTFDCADLEQCCHVLEHAIKRLTDLN